MAKQAKYRIDHSRHSRRSGTSSGVLEERRGGIIEFHIRDPQNEYGNPDVWGDCAIVIETEPMGGLGKSRATKIRIVPCDDY